MRIAAWVSVVLLTAFCGLSSHAAQDAALLRDLTSVITLLGMPCGQVVNARRLNDNDHLATCRDGNRYRVFINAEGRVVAQKQ